MPNNIPTDDFKLDAELNLKSEFLPPKFEEWKAQVEKDLKGASFEKKLITKTYEGINLNPIYTIEDSKNSHNKNSLPGFDNFIRGESTSGYHVKTWNVNQEISLADSIEFNTALIDALQNGQNCINVSLDSATKLGLDADYSDINLVGDTGLSISAIKSLDRALNNIDPTQYHISVHTGAIGLPFLSLFNSLLHSRNIKSNKISGAITADPLQELVKTGNLKISEDFIFNSLKLAVDWSNKNASKLKVIGISTLPYVNSGANSVQEIGIALSTFIYYLNQLFDKGVSPENIFNKTQFTFGISTNYFMEISKFRAIKILLKNIADAYKVDNDKIELDLNAKSAEFYYTKLDPYVNMLRSTTQSFSSIIGGVKGITVTPFDEVIRKPDSFSRRIARNTHTILREESHLDQVIDPAGGSYFVESLTEQIAVKAWDFFKQIENNGGILECLKNDFIQNEIEKISNDRNKDINKRKSVIVGTNMFADVKEKQIVKSNFDQNAFYKKRAEYLNKFRLNGTNEKHTDIMNKLNSISKLTDTEIIDLMTEAFLKGATIGEITSSLISSQKSELKINSLKIKRASEDFEMLRQSALEFQNENGELPKVYLANWGSINEYKTRADFSKGFFEVGGFDVVESKGFSSIEEIVNNSINSKASIIVLCSTDENYEEIVPKVCTELKKQKPEIQIILAGYPKDKIEEYKNYGIDDFIFLGADVMEKISTLLNKLGGQK